VIWVALELQEHFDRHFCPDSAKRLLVTLGIASGVFCGFTSDRDNRWTVNLTMEYYAFDNPDAAGWLPDPGGIIYSSGMDVFFQTFFKQPTADWKYILGFEPGLMRPEDLEVFRKIQWNYGDPRAFEPWVKKMRPQDRMVVHVTGDSSPQVPELEWHYIGSGLWVGRLPQTPNTSPATHPAEPASNGASE